MTDQWTDRLSEYVDDELDARERAFVDEHLASCLACRRVLAELRQVVARAEALPDREPERDLWASIAPQLGAQPSDAKVIELASRRSAARARRVSLTVPQLAAAGIALMILSGSMVWFALGAPRASQRIATTQPADNTRLVSTQPAATADYNEAVRALEQALNQQRAHLDPVTVAVLEENLRAIDSAITEARAALARDPGNFYLNQHLESTMKKKIQLLRRATALRGT